MHDLLLHPGTERWRKDGPSRPWLWQGVGSGWGSSSGEERAASGHVQAQPTFCSDADPWAFCRSFTSVSSQTNKLRTWRADRARAGAACRVAVARHRERRRRERQAEGSDAPGALYLASGAARGYALSDGKAGKRSLPRPASALMTMRRLRPHRGAQSLPYDEWARSAVRRLRVTPRVSAKFCERTELPFVVVAMAWINAIECAWL